MSPAANNFREHGRISAKSLQLDGARTLAALYIETTEKLAEDVLTFQATATEWAKDTPLAVVLEAHHSMARKLVEFSAGTVSRLWRSRKSTQNNVHRTMAANEAADPRMPP